MIVSPALEPAGRTADPARLPVPGPPWSLRLARGSGSRPALEIYEDGTLLDVIVPSPLAPRLLRGARRSVRGGRRRSLAWGRLPADGPGPDGAVTVLFSRGRLRRGSYAALVTGIGTWFWVAVADGWFDRVSVAFGHAVDGGRL